MQTEYRSYLLVDFDTNGSLSNVPDATSTTMVESKSDIQFKSSSSTVSWSEHMWSNHMFCFCYVPSLEHCEKNVLCHKLY